MLLLWLKVRDFNIHLQLILLFFGFTSYYITLLASCTSARSLSFLILRCPGPGEPITLSPSLLLPDLIPTAQFVVDLLLRIFILLLPDLWAKPLPGALTNIWPQSRIGALSGTWYTRPGGRTLSRVRNSRPSNIGGAQPDIRALPLVNRSLPFVHRALPLVYRALPRVLPKRNRVLILSRHLTTRHQRFIWLPLKILLGIFHCSTPKPSWCVRCHRPTSDVWLLFLFRLLGDPRCLVPWWDYRVVRRGGLNFQLLFCERGGPLAGCVIHVLDLGRFSWWRCHKISWKSWKRLRAHDASLIKMLWRVVFLLTLWHWFELPCAQKLLLVLHLLLHHLFLER